jgi:hypothetical protein
LFGPGIISAYELEQKAKFPRIVLAPYLLQVLKTNPLLRHHEYRLEMKEISRLIKKDAAGTVFIDYLGSMAGEGRKPEDYPDFLRIHKRFVENNLTKYEDCKSVLRKYLWLRKYHNAVVRTRIRRKYRADLLIRSHLNSSPEPFLFAVR